MDETAFLQAVARERDKRKSAEEETKQKIRQSLAQLSQLFVKHGFPPTKDHVTTHFALSNEIQQSELTAWVNDVMESPDYACIRPYVSVIRPPHLTTCHFRITVQKVLEVPPDTGVRVEDSVFMTPGETPQ